MKRAFLLGVGAIGIVGLVAGCASEPAPEAMGNQESRATASVCTLAKNTAAGSTALAVTSATLTGACAGGLAVTGPGELLCLLPAGSTTFFSLSAMISAGIAVLTCGNSDSVEVTPADVGTATGTTRLTCAPERHAELKDQKAAACDDLPGGCNRLLDESGGDSSAANPFENMTRNLDQVCLSLDKRRAEYEKCRNIRQQVTDECFGGVFDATHEDQVDTMDRVMSECDRLLAFCR